MDRILHDMPHGEYLATDGVSSSYMKDVVSRSVAYADWRRANPWESDAMAFGTAVHAAVLEPDRYASQIAPMIDLVAEGLAVSTADDAKAWIRDYNHGRAKGDRLALGGSASEVYARVAAAGGPLQLREATARYRAQHALHTLVTPEQFARAAQIGDAVHSHPACQELLASGRPEVSMWTTHAATGLKLKARADWIDFGRRMIVDVKTARDASPSGFGRAAATYHYHLQAAHYVDVASAVTDTDPGAWTWIWLVVETSGEMGDPMQGIALYRATSDQLEVGRDLRELALERIAYAREYADRTPLASGYEPGIIDAQLPRWIYTEVA